MFTAVYCDAKQVYFGDGHLNLNDESCKMCVLTLLGRAEPAESDG